jgi:hypothetical protein
MTALLLVLALAQDAPAPLAGGLIDASGSTLYLAGAAGRIESVDAASGRVKRTFETPGRPIALAGSKLAVELLDPAAGNVVRLAVLDAGTGTVLSTSAAVTFPDWVSTGAANGRHFRSTARVEGGLVVYDWQASASYAGGPAPSREMEAASRKAASGRVSIDLDTFALKTEELPSEAAKAMPLGDRGAVKVGRRTYTIVEGGSVPDPSGRQRTERKLSCASSDPADAAWTYPLRPRFSPVPFP